MPYIRPRTAPGSAHMPFRCAASATTRLARTSAHIARPATLSSPYTLSIRTMATQKTTILDAVADDHQEMYTYYEQYVKHTGDPEAQTRWANQLTWEVARHAVGEELVVYPLMEKHLGAEGKRLADADRADHQTVKELLYQIEALQPGTEDHARLLKSVMDHLRPHNDSEEKTDLPKLMQAIGAEESAKAAKSFSLTKKFVPTRSHPSAPDRPPFETLAGLMAAPLDKLKDAFASFPSAEEKEAAAQEHSAKN